MSYAALLLSLLHIPLLLLMENKSYETDYVNNEKKICFYANESNKQGMHYQLQQFGTMDWFIFFSN
jgi:hypothetical protein